MVNLLNSKHFSSMTLTSFLKPCLSTMHIGVISLAVQYVIALVMYLYCFDLFSFWVMTEQTDPLVGCRCWGVCLAVGLDCQLLVGGS